MESPHLNANNRTLSLDHVQIKQMNCYFSEITEVANTHSHHSMNSNVTFDSESILIITKGGNQFYLPLDQQITQVFPLMEGILIEFQVKA